MIRQSPWMFVGRALVLGLLSVSALGAAIAGPLPEGSRPPAFREPPRLGVYAGSFDPVHKGHLDLAARAFRKLRLDRLLIVPNASNPRKPGLSALSLRADLLRRGLSDLGIPGIEVFPEAAIVAADAAGPPATAFRRIFFAAANSVPGARVFLLCGSDVLPRVLEDWPPRDNSNINLVVLYRPGEEIPPIRNRKRLEAEGRLVVLPGSGLDLSSTKIRAMAASGDLDGLAEGLNPSVFQQVILDGTYGLASTSAWLQALVELYRPPEEARVPANQSYLRSIPFPSFPSGPASPAPDLTCRPVDPEVLEIDFSDTHTLGDWRKYVQQRLTRLGMKILANPAVSLEVLSLPRARFAGFVRRTGREKGVESLRRRDFLSTSLSLVRDGEGRFRAFLISDFGRSRLRHTEAQAVAAFRAVGRDPREIKVWEPADPAQDQTEMAQAFRTALADIQPGMVDAAVIGFQGGIQRSLAERLAIWQRQPSIWAIRDHRLADRWLRGPGRSGGSRATGDQAHPVRLELSAWPIRANPDIRLPHGTLSFTGPDGRPRQLLLTRSVYGDQLAAVLEVLVREKRVPLVIVFGNCGGLGPTLALGDLRRPTAIVDPAWQRRELSNAWRSAVPSWVVRRPEAATVYSVFSPLQESAAFVERLREAGIDLVDVEIAHLEPFQKQVSGTGARVLSLLQVSDLPGSAHTLTDLPENREHLRRSMLQGLDLILAELEVCGPPASSASHALPANGSNLLTPPFPVVREPVSGRASVRP